VTLNQKIIASLVFPVTEILAIEDHKLYDTYLHIAFRSQSILKQLVTKPALIPNEGPDKATRRGG
jgi:hypothetical protein